MGLPQEATPHSKSWPIPLVFAIIEVQDPIHRSWALRKLQDYRRAGNHYVRTWVFVDRICELENLSGLRSNLGDVMRQMDERFII